jgi:CHAT domain-containing protein
VAFYEGVLATARKNVASALGAAAAAGDAGAQIRFLTVLGTGLVYTKLYEQALPYLDKALQVANATPDAGYQFSTYEARLDALIGLKQFDAAQTLAGDMLKQLKLMAARSPAEERNIRDQIFKAEQSRVVTPDVSILKARAHTLVGPDRVERSLNSSSLILEYVVADPQSYCLVISHGGSRLVSLAGREHINALVAAYLKAVKAKQPARQEGRQMYDVLLRPIAEAAQKETLVIIPDGPLYPIPFEGFVDESGRYLVETHTVISEPSGTSFYLLTQEKGQPRTFAHMLLAVGGVPYDTSELK